MSEMKISVEDIGGLEGSHEFQFNEGLNIIHAPNASGKTSLLKALRLTIPKQGEDLDDYLTDGKSRGTVEVSNDFEQKVTLNRSSSGVSYGTKQVVEDNEPDRQHNRRQQPANTNTGNRVDRTPEQSRGSNSR